MYSTWNIPKEYKGACSGGDQVRRLSDSKLEELTRKSMSVICVSFKLFGKRTRKGWMTGLLLFWMIKIFVMKNAKGN